MADPGADGRYEVPPVRLPGSGTARSRARVVAVLVVGIVGGAIGLAVATHPPGSGEAAASPPGVAVRGSGAASSAGSSVAPGRPSSKPRIERLLPIPDRAVDGAPTVDLLERDGDDLRIDRWTPTAGLATVRTLSGALAGLATDTVFALPAPDGRRMLILAIPTDGQLAGDHGRLLDEHGKAAWEGDGLVAQSGAVWSADGRTVVMAGRPRQWRVVTIAASGRATARAIRLPGTVYAPTPIPAGQFSPVAVEPRTLPLGWSADGRWVYGGIVSANIGSLVGSFRVEPGGRRVESTNSLRVGRPDGLLPEPGTIGGRIVDPTSGRIADWRINADYSGGPPTIEVRNPDEGLAFLADAEAPIGSAWGADGGLYVLSANSPIYPERTALHRYDPDGTPGPALLETGPTSGSGLIGVRDGFAVIAITVSRPDSAAQIVLVDVADPSRTTALPVSAAELAGIVSVNLH